MKTAIIYNAFGQIEAHIQTEDMKDIIRWFNKHLVKTTDRITQDVDLFYHHRSKK